MTRPLYTVDVFTSVAYQGNPVAVVLAADGLPTGTMQRFASWMNLSETTFVLPPTAPGADYRVRIFTPVDELPFAGHPTLGTCHAWLAAGGAPQKQGTIVQECAAGLIPVRKTSDGYAFAAPPVLRDGAVDGDTVAQVAEMLRIDPAGIVDAAWADNGPGWVAVRLASADDVLAIKPAALDIPIGAVGPYPDGGPAAFEVRAFFPVGGGQYFEDPVTGSLNASLAHWLLGTGQAKSPYVASQGTAMGRSGRVHVSQDDDGRIWIAGNTVTCVSGRVEL